MLPDLVQRAEVDPQQHRDDHYPDEQADRQVDLRDLQPAYGLEVRREGLAEQNASDDANKHPERQVALEGAHRRRSRASREGRCVHWSVRLDTAALAASC